MIEYARIELPTGTHAHAEIATLKSGVDVQVCRASVHRVDGRRREVVLLITAGRTLPTAADLRQLAAMMPTSGILAGLKSSRSGEAEAVVLPEFETAAEDVALTAAVCAASWGWDESAYIRVRVNDRSWDIVPSCRDGAWLAQPAPRHPEGA